MVLSPPELKTFYDWFGVRQDLQAFYEDAATDDLVRHGDFGTARAVFEFGCGTGRFARLLLSKHLPAGCTYRGVDVSTTMVDLARRALAPFGDVAEVRLSSGAATIEAPDGAYDRIVSNYVLDLLSDDDIRLLLAEARRVLAPGGLLCVVNLGRGERAFDRFAMGVWARLAAIQPWLVGGCRPIAMADYLDAGHWRLRHRRVVSRFGMPSEVVVAAPRPSTAGRRPCGPKGRRVQRHRKRTGRGRRPARGVDGAGAAYFISGTISMAPHGHSAAHMPQPLQ